MATVTIDVEVPGELPEIADVKWAAETFRLSVRAVNDAIQEGYLPSTKVGNSHAIDPLDAVRLWGSRLHRRSVKSARAAN